MTYDLVIRNGTVIDGSGLASYRADLGIVGDRIARIGRINERGAKEIDAEGHVVTPGFIDGHTHMDAQVFWDSLGTCSCWHGVTTVVTGNCGFTLAPVHDDARELVVANLERAEDIPAAALDAGITWSWESFPQFLDALSATPKAINYAAQIGHSALRTFTMGQRAFSDRATEADLVAMEQTLREAMAAGAVGFSTSTSDHHETLDGWPVASRLASWEEITRLVAVVGEGGAGIFQLATETESTESPDEGAARAFYARLMDLAVTTQVPVTFGMRRQHLKAQLETFDATAKAGGRMFGQSRSEAFSQILSFKARMPFDRLPEWRGFRSRPLDEQRAGLLDPAVRKQLVEAVDRAYASGTPTIPGAKVASQQMPSFESLQVMRKGEPNRSVADLARERGLSPIDLMIDLTLATDFAQVFSRFTGWEEPDLLTAMRHPRTVMTFSDAGAHVSQILGASIQTNLLAHWVREEQAFSLEQAVQMLSLVPALAWQIPERGQLREGLIADINIFDPAKVGLGVPTVERDLPAGAPRIKQKATGYLSTIVGGIETFARSEHTGELPGRLVRNIATSA